MDLKADVNTEALESEKPAAPDYKNLVLGFLLSAVLRVINLTLRWKKIGLTPAGKHWTLHTPMILVFWHGDQLMMPWSYRSRFLRRGSRELHAMVSLHADGRMAAKALEHLSISTVDGSSTRGAMRALMQMKQRAAAGHHIAITPDGPKGPLKIAKQGAVLLSSKCGIPLFPVSIVADKSWVLRSWDGMFIPRPFSKMIMIAHEPYTVPPGLSRDELEEQSKNLTECLNSLKLKATEHLALC